MVPWGAAGVQRSVAASGQNLLGIRHSSLFRHRVASPAQPASACRALLASKKSSATWQPLRKQSISGAWQVSRSLAWRSAARSCAVSLRAHCTVIRRHHSRSLADRGRLAPADVIAARQRAPWQRQRRPGTGGTGSQAEPSAAAAAAADCNRQRRQAARGHGHHPVGRRRHCAAAHTNGVMLP